MRTGRRTVRRLLRGITISWPVQWFSSLWPKSHHFAIRPQLTKYNAPLEHMYTNSCVLYERPPRPLPDVPLAPCQQSQPHARLALPRGQRRRAKEQPREYRGNEAPLWSLGKADSAPQGSGNSPE